MLHWDLEDQFSIIWWRWLIHANNFLNITVTQKSYVRRKDSIQEQTGTVFCVLTYTLTQGQKHFILCCVKNWETTKKKLGGFSFSILCWNEHTVYFFEFTKKCKKCKVLYTYSFYYSRSWKSYSLKISCSK